MSPLRKKLRPKLAKVKPSKKKLGLTYILNFYDAYLREGHLNKVAAIFEVAPSALTDKLARFPILQRVMEIANKNRTANNLKGYVTRNLSAPAKAVWDEIQAEAYSVEGIDAIFSGKPKAIRQELFVYSLLTSGFNTSAAMRAVGITQKQFEGWRNDLDFLEMLEEIHFHKKNFFENALLGLVAEAHPGAVLFVNRTVNADRGYSEKLELAHSGEVKNGEGIKLEELNLDMETRKKVLAAVRELKEARNIQQSKPIDVVPIRKMLRRDNSSETDDEI